MGATLHAHIEVKKNGRWLHFGAPSVERNYTLFSAINGERIDLPAGVKPAARIHSLPTDMSEVSAMCLEQDRSGYRLHGMFTLEASDLPVLQDLLYQLCPNVQRTGIDELDLESSIFRTYINGNTLAQHQGWDDLRIIGWYDN